ncbi:MAG: hypothetical protein ABIT37_06250 [Luteolibacter sp.]
MKKFYVSSSPMRFLLFSIFALTGVLHGQTAPDERPVLNRYVLAAIKTMPDGGGYDSSQAAVDRLAASVKVEDGVIHQDLTVAKASFCSGATYLVFLRAVELLRKNGSLRLSPEAVALLADLGVKDGERVFGRWNSNGPGTAKLFAELGCGRNFTAYDEARPGDFMKIWWTAEIGGKERGHLVVYLDSSKSTVRFWSANQPGGYGIRTVEKETIQRVLFSRLERVDKLENVVKLSAKNEFLADMLDKPFTWDRVVKECAVRQATDGGN